MGMNKIGSLLSEAARYTETDETGSVSDTIEAGVRTRQVTKVILCYKNEVHTILAAVDATPSELLTCGGRNPDGTPANYVNWGAGYEYSGADVNEISPNFSKLNLRYKATDPAGGTGVARSGGTLGGGIIGRPWEGGKRYVETPSSGKATDNKVYIASSFGWNRERQVQVNLICEKTDSRTVADGLELSPSALTTNPHNGASIAWGSGYSLVSIYGTSISPSFYAISAKYRRNQAWAICHPPAGVSLTCVAGVCAINWGGVKFEEFDSGLPTNDNGIDVQIINGSTILMTCNGIPLADFTPGVITGDKVLEWATDGNTAQLKFMNEIWKEYIHG